MLARLHTWMGNKNDGICRGFSPLAGSYKPLTTPCKPRWEAYFWFFGLGVDRSRYQAGSMTGYSSKALPNASRKGAKKAS